LASQWVIILERLVTEDVQCNGKPETTEGAKAEATAATEGLSGSTDGTADLPSGIAPIEQSGNNLPAIVVQAETFLPANLPPELEPGWVAPPDWGLQEWLNREEKLAYWDEGIGRLDALVTKRRGECFWHCRDWFRQRKEQIKTKGKKLRDESLTWTKLLHRRKWDRATVSRKIKFYWKHRNTPDDQLNGQSICNMWDQDADYMSDPPVLGQFYEVAANCRMQVSDERGGGTSTQMIVEEGTIIEVAAFNDGNYNDTVVRIKSGLHAGQYFTVKGASLSYPVDPAKVPDLIKAIEDARKTKPKKRTSKGAIAVSLPPADAPVWVFNGDPQFTVQKVGIKDGRCKLLNEAVNLFLQERVKIVTKVKDQTVLQVVVPHGFDFFRVASNKLTSLFTRENDLQPEQPPKPPTEGAVDEQQALSEDYKEGLAQLVSFLAFLERWKPTLREYTLLGKKLDDVCRYVAEMREQVEGAEEH